MTTAPYDSGFRVHFPNNPQTYLNLPQNDGSRIDVGAGSPSFVGSPSPYLHETTSCGDH